VDQDLKDRTEGHVQSAGLVRQDRKVKTADLDQRDKNEDLAQKGKIVQKEQRP
jgi:hypothetical protein